MMSISSEPIEVDSQWTVGTCNILGINLEVTGVIKVCGKFENPLNRSYHKFKKLFIIVLSYFII